MGKSMLRPSIIVYTIGEDISEEKYREAIEKMADWLAQTRKSVKEPVVRAKQLMDACLQGRKPSDGGPWESAATVSLATRVRMAARFDIETMKGLETASERTKAKKAKEKARLDRRRAEKQKDLGYPEEYREKSPVELSYGDDPRAFFTTAERANYTRKQEALLKQFPQLDNVAQESKVAMYITLQILFERMQFRALAAGAKKDEIVSTERAMEDLTKRIVDLEKAMGIDPVTLHKTQDKKEGGTIGDAIRRFESMGDWREVRLKYWVEEMLLIYTMFMSSSPRTDMGSYQLDEVGLYGLTKTRVVECPHCGNTNWSGLKIEEIEQWLIDHGYLVPVETVAVGDYLTTASSSGGADAR